MPNTNELGVTTSQRLIPFIKIVHQPSAIYRMRYKAENRKTFLYAENYTATSPIPLNNSINLATNSETNKKSVASKKKHVTLATTSASSSSKIESADGVFPKIEIVNGHGPATLIVTCVNKTEPYHVHPHRLVGNQCKSGVAVINIDRGQKIFELTGVSIEFTKKNDIEQSLDELKSKNVDPFNVGFNFDRNKIDLTQIRLCFQVYLRDTLDSNEIIRDQYHILKPVVSNIISNSSRKSTLQILRTSNMFSSASGGQNVVLFLKKLEKDQKTLSVKFFDENGWSSTVEIKDNTIHYQCAIMFNAPPYINKDIKEDTMVSLKVFVPFASDNERKEFIKQQIAEDNEDIDVESSEALNMQTADFLKGDSLDGKYESTKLDFKYTPNIVNKRKLENTGVFYEFIDPADKEVKNKISEISRKKLAKRQIELSSDENSIDLHNISDLVYTTNPLSLNHTIRYAEDLNLMNLNQERVDIDEFIYSDEQIQAAVEANYPKSADKLLSDQSNISIENVNPSSSKQHDEPDGIQKEVLLNKSIQLLSIPSFSIDPDATEIIFEDLFNQ